MKITGRFKKPMIRQLDEAIIIQRRDPKTLLNSKKKFYGPAIQRKILERKGLPLKTPEKSLFRPKRLNSDDFCINMYFIFMDFS